MVLGCLVHNAIVVTAATRKRKNLSSTQFVLGGGFDFFFSNPEIRGSSWKYRLFLSEICCEAVAARSKENV